MRALAGRAGLAEDVERPGEGGPADEGGPAEEIGGSEEGGPGEKGDLVTEDVGVADPAPVTMSPTPVLNKRPRNTSAAGASTRTISAVVEESKRSGPPSR